MRWLNTEPRDLVPVGARLALLRDALVRRDDPDLHARLGDALLQTGDAPGAIRAYERAARDPAAFTAWPRLAIAYLRLGQAQTALEVCDRGDAHRPTSLLSCQRGRALHALRRFAEARAALEQAVARGDPSLLALKMLLDPLAAAPDGRRLLDYCDGLPERYQGTAVVLAHRAIAFSRLGRLEEARLLVDLERHIRRVRLDVPADFNRALTEEILAAPEPEASDLEGFEITYRPPSYNRPAMSAILAAMREQYAIYIADLAAMGLDTVLPPPPDAAVLYGASLVLTRGGSNGEHIHGKGYVSCVYHAAVPDEVARAEDGRGALVFGTCDRYTRGHRACWGARQIRPEPGWLTLFPSHVFHDVIPTRSRQPRVSVSSDLWPAD